MAMLLQQWPLIRVWSFITVVSRHRFHCIFSTEISSGHVGIIKRYMLENGTWWISHTHHSHSNPRKHCQIKDHVLFELVWWEWIEKDLCVDRLMYWAVGEQYELVFHFISFQVKGLNTWVKNNAFHLFACHKRHSIVSVLWIGKYNRLKARVKNNVTLHSCM